MAQPRITLNTPMTPLTQAEEAELQADTWRVVQDFRFIGIDAVIILRGRGVNKIAYHANTAPIVPTMLSTAYRDVRKNNDKD